MAEVKDPPLGTITVYAGNFVPDLQTWEEDHGWMLCDGRLLDRTVYAAMKRCLQVVLLTLAFLSQTVIAQDADVCRELLKFGVFDSEDTLSASQNHILLQDFFCTDQSRDLATAKQRAQRSGISLGVFEIKLSGSDDSTTSEQTYEKWRNRMCHLQATEAQDQLLLKTEARRVARALMDGFTRCVELRSSSPGLISFIETTKERRQVFFKAKFIQDSGEGPIAIRSITVSTVPASAHTCDFSEWARGERIGAREKTLLCTVEPTNTVTFLLSARRSGSGSSETTTKILEGVTRPEPIPVISGFRVDPPSLDSGQSADLIWNVEGAGRVLLSPDPSGASQQAVSVPSEGRVKITPAITTTYSLQAFGPTGQTDVKTTSVVVSIPPPRITSATFNPPEVFVGNQRSELSWEASGSTSAVIVEGIGRFAGRTGRVMVGPISDDKEFVVTAVGDERIHNPDHHTIVLHKKVRAVGFQAIGFGTDDPAHARPIQIFTNQHLPPEWRNQISSIQVLTNEWVILHKMNDFSFCFALKGPKNYDNLHNIRLELGPRFFTFSIHAGDFAEAIDFSATEPTNCQTRLR